MIGNFLLYDENYQLKNRKNKYTYQRKNILYDQAIKDAIRKL